MSTVYGFPPSNNNLIYHNNLINNFFSARDNGHNNGWDHGGGGNYWSDYTGQDANGDGIVMWDGSSLSSLGSGVNGNLYALKYASTGNLYAGGTFNGLYIIGL